MVYKGLIENNESTKAIDVQIWLDWEFEEDYYIIESIILNPDSKNPREISLGAEWSRELDIVARDLYWKEIESRQEAYIENLIENQKLIYLGV